MLPGDQLLVDGNVSSKIVEPSTGQQESQQATPSVPTRSKILQRLLDASSDLPVFVNDLLTTQAVHVAGTEAAAFLIERREGQVGLRLIAHIRPDESSADVRQAAVRAFQNLVQPCVQQSKDGAIEVGSPDGGDAQYCLVTILASEGEVVAVSAVITRCRDMERAKQRLASMQLVSGYFELYALRRHNEMSGMMADRHQNVLQFTGVVSNAEGFEAAATGLCNELATRTGASLVGLGWLKGQQVKVKALSHTEKFDKKQELVVQLRRSMEECYDQEEPVRFDPGGNSQNVTRCAAELSRMQGGGAVMSAPLRRRDDIVGVVTLGFPPQHKIDEQVEGAVGVAVELLAPQLYDRYENDRFIWVKMGHSIRNVARLALGPKHMGVKLLIVSVIALICFVTFYKPMYRVRAPFTLVAEEKRVICAPYDGTLREVLVKPGWVVKKDDVLAKMDTYQREIDLLTAQAEVNTQAKEADIYRAAPDKLGQYNVALAKKAGAEAQVKRLQEQISQATIKAPFDCHIILGDLYVRQGAPAKQGEQLFEVAKLDPTRPGEIAVEAELQVSERDIQEVTWAHKQRMAKASEGVVDGELATTTFPSEGFKFTIKRIVPQGKPKEGENAFSVFAAIDGPDDRMKPGIGGEARVAIAPRSVAWWWTHRLVDWLKLKLWI